MYRRDARVTDYFEEYYDEEPAVTENDAKTNVKALERKITRI